MGILSWIFNKQKKEANDAAADSRDQPLQSIGPVQEAGLIPDTGAASDSDPVSNVIWTAPEPVKESQKAKSAGGNDGSEPPLFEVSSAQTIQTYAAPATHMSSLPAQPSPSVSAGSYEILPPEPILEAAERTGEEVDRKPAGMAEFNRSWTIDLGNPAKEQKVDQPAPAASENRRTEIRAQDNRETEIQAQDNRQNEQKYPPEFYHIRPLPADYVKRTGMNDSDDSWDWSGDCIAVGNELYSGILYMLYSDGNLREYEQYKYGFAHGGCYLFYESGKLKMYEEKRYGNRHGLRLRWEEDGTLISEEEYVFLHCVRKKERQPDGTYKEQQIELSNYQKKNQEREKRRQELIEEKYEKA